MKDNFYRNRMIFRIVMYLVFYAVFFIWHLYRHQFLWRYAFQGLNGIGFFIYSEMEISIITTIIILISLIWEIIAKKGGKHIFTIVQLIIAMAVNVILFINWHKGSVLDLNVFYLDIVLIFMIWICWEIEFIIRKKNQSAVKGRKIEPQP